MRRCDPRAPENRHLRRCERWWHSGGDRLARRSTKDELVRGVVRPYIPCTLERQKRRAEALSHPLAPHMWHVSPWKMRITVEP